MVMAMYLTEFVTTAKHSDQMALTEEGLSLQGPFKTGSTVLPISHWTVFVTCCDYHV